MKNKLIILTGIIFALLIGYHASAQTQIVKGTVVDAQADYPLIGATVRLLNTTETIGAVTDINGQFRLENVPVGRQSLAVQYLGYKSSTLPNVLVTIGKEVEVHIKLEESVEKLDEIVVSANGNKAMPINELAKVSARTFSMEEVTRFSGGRNDVARLAVTFAGVSAPNDSRNDIVVRGNSPTGLLWRVNGMPMATTNHFATLGTTGGPVNALNTNMLRTSDFLTGAFPAEYGNANAAVFDVNFRNGNADKFEFTGQVAFTGAEAMIEGPLSKKKQSSFLVSYRYGIAAVAATGTSAIPYYQDLSFKLNFGESKVGRFELFGMGGLSSIDFLGADIDEDDLFANPNQDSYVSNDLGIAGLNHILRIGKTANLKTGISVSTNSNQYLEDNFVRNANEDVTDIYRSYNVENRETRVALTSTLNKKFNAKWLLRTGFLIETYLPDFFSESRDNNANIPDDNGDGIPDYFIPITDFQEQYTLSQIYAQAAHNVTDKLNFTFGLHSQYHGYTGAFALEPRAAISLDMNRNQRISFAYGLHAQSTPSPILFFEEEVAPGVYEKTNTGLGFMKSNHFVLAYDKQLGQDWRLKAEAYFQYQYDIPVESISSSYSVLNEGSGFVFDQRGSLVNEGSGRNFGLELTLEKFFSKGYYVLVTTSLFDSKYKGSDDVLRNTAFNSNYVFNTLFGKEWKFGRDQRHAFTFDTKFTTSGGQRYTEIDLEGTQENDGDVQYFEDEAFEQQLANYMRWDVKFGVRMNSAKRRMSHQFYIDFQNVTNRENDFVSRYNEVSDQIDVVSQIGFFTDIMYRITF
ncbi:MAG: TonB-dependent receptor [Reichenbachiella sp.]